jgi:LysM repeat protein
MSLKRFFICFLILFSSLLFAQEQTKHVVVEGETISKIAQKYKVTPFDIYKLNPDAQSGAKPGMVLIIPKYVTATKPLETPKPVDKPVVTKPAEKPVVVVPSKPKEIKAETKPVTTTVVKKENLTHIVIAKDNLYNIAKKYNVSVEEIEKNNPSIVGKGLQPGMKLVIKNGVKTVSTNPKTPKTPVTPKIEIITHEVLPKETKYGIATKYGVSVEELERQNPEVLENLPIGYVIKIDKSKVVSDDDKPKVIELKDPNSQIKPVSKPLFDYNVKAGETLYSLSRLLGLTQEQLISLNPTLIDGLKEGMILKVPADVTIVKETKSEITTLANSIKTNNKKELVLLLPFNASKVLEDSSAPIASKIKNDKFLNMTLDFYSGALMAIDSAKVLGLNVDVSIYDSEETRTSTSAILIVQQKAQSANAVIGPFYQANVEKVAQELQPLNIPVISPLSKEISKTFPNLYNSMPSEDALKKKIFAYMNERNGNIIAVVEPNYTEITDYIKTNHTNVKWAGLNAKGLIVSDSIKKHFVKDKINYVVLESEKYGNVQATLATMNAALKDYRVQLIITKPNPIFEFDEIAISTLVNLKLTYPSLYNENESARIQQFEKEYRINNKVNPNQFAIRGFDLVFDTMLRLSQEQSFEESISQVATEYIENKFDYVKNISGGYANDGIFILSYQPDLTIKSAE